MHMLLVSFKLFGISKGKSIYFTSFYNQSSSIGTYFHDMTGFVVVVVVFLHEKHSKQTWSKAI